MSDDDTEIGFRAPQFQEVERTMPAYIKWQSIAFDIILRTPADLLCRMHDMTTEQLKLLLADRRFVAMARDTKSSLDKGGVKATFKMRAGMIAEELLPELRRVALSGLTEAKVKLSIMDALTRYSELDPSIGKGKHDGVVVNFAFGAGMPGLSRLSNQPEAITINQGSEA